MPMPPHRCRNLSRHLISIFHRRVLQGLDLLLVRIRQFVQHYLLEQSVEYSKMRKAGEYETKVFRKKQKDQRFFMKMTINTKNQVAQFIKISYMTQMNSWQVQLHQQTLTLDELSLIPLDIGCKKQEGMPYKNSCLEVMEESRQKEAKCISNYFAIDSIHTFTQTLTAIAQILHIDPHSLKGRLEAAKIKTTNAGLQAAEALQTTRAKFQLCFSRRWREQQTTIFLVLQQFVTPELSLKTRVLIINQRGLILQALSNLDSSNYFASVAKVLKSSYTRLQNLVILVSMNGFVNLDSMQAFKNSLRSVNIVMVTFGDRKKVQQVERESLSLCNGVYLLGSSGIKLAKYCRQQIILWYIQQNQLQFIEKLLLNLAVILRRERKVSNLFIDFPYNHHQFNQKQFLVRLFSFYFNFIALEGMDKSPDEDIKRVVPEECTKQLLQKQLEVEQKSKQREVHSFTTNQTSLHCPVCRKRSKITCLKCCDEFGTKFALCQVSCFEKFHEDRIRYAGGISNRKRVNDFLIQDRGRKCIEQQEDAKKEEDSQAPPYVQARTLEEVRQKWRSVYQNERRQMQIFVRMSSMNLVPQKYVDRMNILSHQIQQISKKKLVSRTIVKMEQ